MDLSIVSQFMSLSPDMMYKATKMVESAKAYFPGDVDAQEQYLNENLIDTTLEYALTLLEDKKIRDYMGVAVYTNGTTFSAPTLALYNVASMPEMKQRIQGKLNAKSGVRKEETELVQEKKRPKLKGRKFNGKNPWWNSDGDDKPYEPGDDVRKTKNEETSVERIDRISREKVAQRAMAAKKDREARAASAAKFKEFKSAHIASGGTPVSALDAWQKKKMASAKKESVDYVAELWRNRNSDDQLDEVKGYGGHVDPTTGKSSGLRSPSQQAHATHWRNKQQGKDVPDPRRSKFKYGGSKGSTTGAHQGEPPEDFAKKQDPDLATTPANRMRARATSLAAKGKTKQANKIRSVMNRPPMGEEFTIEAKNKEGKEQGLDGKACWKGYKKAGTKMKGGKLVDNCVKMEDVEFVADYLISEGLNEYGIDILIEEMGLDDFCDFVDEISTEEVLLEWRRGAGGTKVRGSGMSKSGKSIGSLKGGAKASAIRGSAEHKARKAEKEKESSKSSGMKAALQSQSKIAMAKKSQPATKSTPTQTKEKAKGGILGALKARAQRDTELLKKSVDTARKVGARRAAEVKATYDAVRAKGKEAEKSASATRARRKATVAAGRAAQAAGRTAVKAAGAAGAAAGEAVKAKRAGKTAAQVAGRAAGTFVKKMKKEERELLTHYFIESEIAFNYDEVQEIFETLDQEHFDYFIEQAMLMVEESGPSARELIEEKLQNTFDIERFTFADWRHLTEKNSGDEATGKFVNITQTNRTDNDPSVKGKRKDGVIINPQVDMRREEFEQLDEVSPPGEKFKRMAKHIKAGYAKDGLTKKEKGIAFATAWKQYKKQQQEQADPEAAKTAAQGQQKMKAQQQMQRKQLVLQQQRLQMQKQGKLPMGHMEEVEHLDELNRYEKETGKSSGSMNMPAGRPTQKGGDTDPALRSVRQTMRKMSGKPAGQQKKVPGKKPPVAGQYGARKSPAQIVQQRRDAAKRAQDNMSSRFD